MDFLQTPENQILVGVAVAVVAIGIGAVYLFSSKTKKPKGVLDPENFREFKLVKRVQLSHNVAKFTFGLPTPTSVLGLPIGQHISCRGKDGQGEEVIKPYTPTTLDSDVGHFELVIKMYPQGRMSHHFREMRVGDYLAVKGPKGRFKYQPGEVRAFGMLAGGSGITPMFQVARAILENPKDKTKVHLIYANVTSEDILLKVVKQRMQTGQLKSAPAVVRLIVANEGLKGLFAGYRSFLLRDLPFDALELCIYEQLRIGYKRAAKRDLNDPENAMLGAFAVSRATKWN